MTQASTNPELRDSISPLGFMIVILLPNNAANPSLPCHYPDIDTNMPLFSHTVRSLEGKVRLGHLSINTTERVVNVDVCSGGVLS